MKSGTQEHRVTECAQRRDLYDSFVDLDVGPALLVHLDLERIAAGTLAESAANRTCNRPLGSPRVPTVLSPVA